MRDTYCLLYMHCCLLGICRMLLHLWLQSSQHNNSWYKVLQLDDGCVIIIHQMRFKEYPVAFKPQFLNGKVSVQLYRVYWSHPHHAAHELRAWLLHYSPIVLYKILDNEYYQHHLLLVESVYLLLQQSVRKEAVDKCQQLLNHYCFVFGPLYGNWYTVAIILYSYMQLIIIIGHRYMSWNVHSLLHLPDCVRCLGPLWAHSCFPFENANGHMLKLFHGSQGVGTWV